MEDSPSPTPTRADLLKQRRSIAKLLDLERGNLGADHPDTLATMHNLANMYLGQGNYEEAEKLYRETLQIQQRVLGPDHPDTANDDDDTRKYT